MRGHVETGATARLVAGFCWPWSKPDRAGELLPDVQIGGWARPWNARPDAGRLRKGIPPAALWAYDRGGIDQVGCVYTAIQFIVGVIWDPTNVSVANAGSGIERLHDSVVAFSDGLSILPRIPIESY
jgi:hypothetical protein